MMDDLRWIGFHETTPAKGNLHFLVLFPCFEDGSFKNAFNHGTSYQKLVRALEFRSRRVSFLQRKVFSVDFYFCSTCNGAGGKQRLCLKRHRWRRYEKNSQTFRYLSLKHSSTHPQSYN
ncbi:hypothetical protein NPIL_227821 [Nephila pilipes]|uniref:Uncharacterized protein n=1 Tax=Nephila pilipes TaxID=299642 RepID=A0A8X6I3D1_NEPPI|nr:hypothetical protein NPIL_227821 [Nephila pilipes]